MATRDKSASGGAIKNENISNQELTKDLHKPIIRNFNKRKVHSPFIEHICGGDLADIQLIIKFNFFILLRFRLLLSVIDIYSKYAWIIR